MLHEQRIVRLAKQYGRFGYRDVAKLLLEKDWTVNHKKIERIRQEARLQLPTSQKKGRRVYHPATAIIRPMPPYPNHVWAVDVMHDNPVIDRFQKMQTLLDEHMREALCGAVALKMDLCKVLEPLHPLLPGRGKPKNLRAASGPEFVVGSLQEWFILVVGKPIHNYPSSPRKLKAFCSSGTQKLAGHVV